MKHEAIYDLYSNVTTINEDDNGIFTAYDENGNLISIDMSAVNNKAAELQAIEDAKPSREELKASAKAKLMAGEALTEDEANVMIGG
tara:strand:+ start:1384 stop:1644 length:261 start_codon:yes stop_codon:yes gene_type:complete